MDKFALVTGSTKGIGKAIGISLLQRGYYVIFNYSSSESGKVELISEIERFEGKYSIIKAHLSNIEGARVLFNQTKDITTLLDVIVFNAGTTDRTSFPNIDYDNWNNVISTNLSIPLMLAQIFYKFMSSKGNFIFIGSLMGEIEHSMSLSYGVTKSAVHSLVKNLVKFVREKEIRVNGVAPGFIDTEWQLTKKPEIRRSIESKIALNKFGSVEHVSNLVMHIIENNYINGEIYKIDGGYNYF